MIFLNVLGLCPGAHQQKRSSVNEQIAMLGLVASLLHQAVQSCVAIPNLYDSSNGICHYPMNYVIIAILSHSPKKLFSAVKVLED